MAVCHMPHYQHSNEIRHTRSLKICKCLAIGSVAKSNRILWPFKILSLRCMSSPLRMFEDCALLLDYVPNALWQSDLRASQAHIHLCEKCACRFQDLRWICSPPSPETLSWSLFNTRPLGRKCKHSNSVAVVVAKAWFVQDGKPSSSLRKD